jgi:hypothetical protein
MATTNQKQNTQVNKEMFITASWRRTGMGAITHPIALKKEGNQLRLVKPIKEFSRTGNHGRFFYLRDKVDVLIYLEQSNSGKRSVILSICRLQQELCGRIVDIAETLWISGAHIADVEKALTLLQL